MQWLKACAGALIWLALPGTCAGQCSFSSISVFGSVTTGEAWFETSAGYSGNSFTINFTGTGCTWQVQAPSPVSFTGATSGTASTTSVTVPFNILANTSSSPISVNITVLVNGSQIPTNLSVDENSPNCAITSLSPPSANFPASGGSGSFTEYYSPSSCYGALGGWASWVTALTQGGVLGASTWSYTVSANTGSARQTQINFSMPSPATFTINQAGTGPAVTSLSPSSATAGGPAFTLTVNGSGFVSGAVVDWNGSALATTYVSATQLTAQVPASLIATAGTAQIVVNQSGTISNSVSFTINTGPVITAIIPSSVTAGAGAVYLGVTGSGFVSGAVVDWNGSPLSTTFVSATLLTASVPATLTAVAGTATITVVLGAATSNSLTFTINQTFGLTITTSSIAGGLVGVVYPATAFAVHGGTGPYQWSSSGTLPGTMSLSTGGVLSGTPSAAGSFPFTVTVQDSSAPPLTQQANFTLVVTQPTTLLSVTPQQVSFAYVQGDSNLPPAQNIGVLSNPAGTGVSVTSTTSDGGTWLRPVVSLSSGKTPGTIAVGVNPASLAANTYSGLVNISAPNATPSSVTVNVTLTVSPSQPPQLTVTPSVQSFALPQGGQSQGAVVLANSGGGTLNYGTAASSDADWLTLSGSGSGTVTPSTPASIAFTVNAGAGLAPGLHAGQITVTELGTQSSQVANVALLVNGSQATMLLSQTGMTFFAVQNASVAVPAQSVSIFNLGAGTLSWSTQVQYLAANQSWLTVTLSGSSSSGTPGQATATVNPTGLAEGQYYALVNVVSAGAVNSPQSVSVLLNVVEAGELGSAPQVSTSGVIAAAAAGSATAVTQAITVFSPAGANLNYSTSVYTADGGSWLSVTPVTGSLGAAGAGSISVQASAAAMSTGVYYGTLQVAFSEGTVQTIQVPLVATPGASGAGAVLSAHAAPAVSCTPTKLVATFASPGANAQLQVSQPQNLQVQILDDCGAPLLPTQETSPVVYINSASPQALSSNNNVNGIWTGQWTPSSAQGNVQLRVFAARGQTFGGISTPPPPNSVVNVTVLPANTNSAPQLAGVLNAASFDLSNPGLVVPGGYVSIYGDRMANAAQQASMPLPVSLGSTQLLLGGKPLPLLYVAPGQVNGLIPQSVSVDTEILLTVQRGTAGSVPVSAYVTGLQPGIFTTAQNGQGQGSILINGTPLVAGAGPGQQPVGRGQWIQIYATGLGAVAGPSGSTPPADGQPAPMSGVPLFSTIATATATIGGVNAPVNFSGLAPGYVALYQVNAQVPSGAPVGSAVPLVLTMTDSNGHSVSSQTVTIAVQ
ncbi:MAG: putative Ig domain-containing protein [Bryobacteraceae bacterium]